MYFDETYGIAVTRINHTDLGDHEIKCTRLPKNILGISIEFVYENSYNRITIDTMKAMFRSFTPEAQQEVLLELQKEIFKEI